MEGVIEYGFMNLRQFFNVILLCLVITIIIAIAFFLLAHKEIKVKVHKSLKYKYPTAYNITDKRGD